MGNGFNEGVILWALYSLVFTEYFLMLSTQQLSEAILINALNEENGDLKWLSDLYKVKCC